MTPIPPSMLKATVGAICLFALAIFIASGGCGCVANATSGSDLNRVGWSHGGAWQPGYRNDPYTNIVAPPVYGPVPPPSNYRNR